MALPKNTRRKLGEAAKLMDAVAVELSARLHRMLAGGEYSQEVLSAHLWQVEKAIGAGRIIGETIAALDKVPVKKKNEVKRTTRAERDRADNANPQLTIGRPHARKVA
jgi:ABC-type hemin transport system ATPase subunit